MEQFLKNGVGYCIIENGTIASWCLSTFAVDDQIELAVITEEDFRGKGYAKQVAFACIKYCQEKRKQPLWNCDDENVSSIVVAEGVGFKKSLDYDVFKINV
ncbi:GNAT family N-acetyltransferase [Evansella halocellulosilytica]|uniref:GNAT family N-acetyltransferase n=1 Tax=Evansella halocellulosilytica TaxID=2011013 RepID=UPI0015C8B0E9|nr:GNAT family N-acetyltransferase [Evansella halocellulosilytica]